MVGLQALDACSGVTLEIFQQESTLLKFPIVERQEINLVLKIEVFVGSKIWYFNKFYLFLFSKILGCYTRACFIVSN
jgi:hypothetical protein